MLERWRERDVFRESLRRRAGRRAVGLLRGPADRQRPPGLPPRARARLQGHLPALQDDARLLRRAQGRLGLPRAAGRDRGRAAARHHAPSTRSRPTASPSSTSECRESVFEFLEDWNALTERIGFWIDLDDAYRTLDTDYIESVWWALRQICGQGPALRGPQGRALLPALRHRAVQRTRSRWATRTSSTRRVYVRFPSPRTAARCRPATSCSSGRRRRGRSSPTRRSRSTPSSPTCARRRAAGRAVRARRGARRARARRRSRRSLDRFPGAALDGVRYEPPFPLHRGRRLRRARPHRAARPTSSPPTTAPASCTPRSRSARTTSASARSTG